MPGPNVPFPPMEAELVSELPRSGEWQYEPKWDGLSAGEPMVPPRGPSFTPRGALTSAPLPPGEARLRVRRPALFELP